MLFVFFFSSRRRHTRWTGDWSSDVCSSDLETVVIERRPTKGTTLRGGESFQDHTIEVHEMYEEPVIGKVITQAEEMVIYKTLSERTATVRETVRQTQVNVDGQAKIQVRPPLEIAGEISLKVEEPPTAPIQSQVETGRETSL